MGWILSRNRFDTEGWSRAFNNIENQHLLSIVSLESYYLANDLGVQMS